ncbi:MAG: hypothetical protein R3301_08955 [Saprospiraceae bacterium]|nr:hypothetical protein [Saprospiraceae bacterium]
MSAQRRKRLLFGWTLVLLMAIAVLVLTPSLAVIRPVNGLDFPIGTLTTWLGFVALPSVLFYAIPSLHARSTGRVRVYRRLFIMCIVLGCLWGIGGYLLAGNWAYNFSGNSPAFQGSAEAGVWFMRLTYGIAVLTLSVAMLYGLHELLCRVIKRR